MFSNQASYIGPTWGLHTLDSFPTQEAKTIMVNMALPSWASLEVLVLRSDLLSIKDHLLSAAVGKAAQLGQEE